jgi:[ribosomal protein S5]-alanine N-acetyltransferase
MPHPPEVLVGQSIRLRRSTPEDAPCIYRIAASPEVMRYMDWPAHKCEQDARDFLDGCAERWSTGTEYHWVVEELPHNQVIGSIACRVQGDAADFGYFIARDSWGRGYATEAAGLVVAWLRAQPEILRIWATTDYENHASERVLRKVGLEPEGMLPLRSIRPNLGGAPRDTKILSIVIPRGATHA